MKSSQVLHLEAGLEKDRVRISLAIQQSGETQTVRQVEELTVAMPRIDRRCSHMHQSLNLANRRGQLPPDILDRLVENGQLFRDELFSPTIKERLNNDTTEALILTLDDHLVHIPWELLHDGQQFLGQRYAVGRVVRTRQPVTGSPMRTLASPLRMLVLADPCGDLKAAYDEGIRIRNLADALPRLQVTFRSTGVKADFLKAKLRHYDLVHFAGHADFNEEDYKANGWRLGSGRLTAAHIHQMAGTGAMPALVFANACQSARTGPGHARSDVQRRLFDMANAFILSGVRHYMGTFWEIPDAQSEHFALSFYDKLLEGETVGAAVLAARRNIMARFGERNIVWASYLLYGDPTASYFQPAAPPQENRQAPPPQSHQRTSVPPSGMRAPEDTFHLSGEAQPPASGFRIWGTVFLLLLAALAGLWLFVKKPGSHADEEKALAAFNAGRYEQVRQVCGDLQRERPNRSLGYVLMANVHFLEGDLERACRFYEQALNANEGPEMEKAEAYMGLGRIASVRGSTDQALDYYRQASFMAPDKEQPLVARALLQNRAGRPEQAVALLDNARHIAADSKTIESLALQIQANAALAADKQRQERIDRLIGELSARMDTTPGPATTPETAPSGNTLTLWLNDLETVGYSLQEGTATLIASGLMERLLETRRIKLVERDLLDGLMNEIKLGTSELTQPQTQLQLGRLTAARIILTGRVVHSAPAVQVTLRCIETDTGQIFAVVNAHYETQPPVAHMVDHLFDQLISKIKTRYPLLTGTGASSTH